jgi:hypothetical protein
MGLKLEQNEGGNKPHKQQKIWLLVKMEGNKVK